MSVLLETSVGDIVLDLYTDKCPKTTRNFLKLCKIKYCTPAPRTPSRSARPRRPASEIAELLAAS